MAGCGRDAPRSRSSRAGGHGDRRASRIQVMIISLKVSDLHLPSQLATTAADLTLTVPHSFLILVLWSPVEHDLYSPEEPVSYPTFNTQNTPEPQAVSSVTL